MSTHSRPRRRPEPARHSRLVGGLGRRRNSAGLTATGGEMEPVAAAGRSEEVGNAASWIGLRRHACRTDRDWTPRRGPSMSTPTSSPTLSHTAQQPEHHNYTKRTYRTAKRLTTLPFKHSLAGCFYETPSYYFFSLLCALEVLLAPV